MADISIPQKRCVACNKSFPQTREYFYRDGDGFKSRCKSCYSLYEGCKPKDTSVPDGMKRCSKCKTIYPATVEYFRKSKLGKYGVRSLCYKCDDEYEAIRRATPKYKASQKKYTQTEKCKARTLKYENSPRRKELNRLREKSPKRREYTRQYARKYRRNNKLKVVASGGRRLQRERTLPNAFTEADEKYMFDYWDYKCCICGKSAGLWHLIVEDHWIPVSDEREDNPGYVPWNIVPMCHTIKGAPIGEACCNNSKYNKDPIEWLHQKFGERKAKQKLKEIEAYFLTTRKG